MEALFSDGGVLDEFNLCAKLDLTSEQVREVLDRVLSVRFDSITARALLLCLYVL